MRKLILLSLLMAGCAAPESSGLAPAGDGTGAMVRFDMYARPFPDVPLPNDLATRFDANSKSGLRVKNWIRSASAGRLSFARRPAIAGVGNRTASVLMSVAA